MKKEKMKCEKCGKECETWEGLCLDCLRRYILISDLSIIAPVFVGLGILIFLWTDLVLLYKIWGIFLWMAWVCFVIAYAMTPKYYHKDKVL
jgi:hypothetical protein